MKGVRKIMDRMKPTFNKGGKLSALESTFNAFETFLFVPKTTTKHGTHIRDCNDLKRTMIVVVMALVPALLFGMYNTGLQYFRSLGVADTPDVTLWLCFSYGFLKILPMIVVSYAVGLGIEFISAQVRGHEVSEGFLVSGLLIPMIMPIDLPIWMLALATAFAVIFGKEVFGGTGMNIFNPALLARAFVFFAYTPHISGDRVWVTGMKTGEVADGFSGATPLTELSRAASEGTHMDAFANGSSPIDWFIGTVPGTFGETSTLAILLGAALLLYTGVASWKIMLSVVGGGLFAGLIFNLLGLNAIMEFPAHYHLITGGFAFGAVFMATDPVTAAQTERGKWISGFLIGLFAITIRAVNPGYPEGMMLAILFMNAMTPLIDYYVVAANIRRRKRRVLNKNQRSEVVNS